MEKNYLSSIIGDTYKQWGRKKIIIEAPTGMGKSTFLLKKIVPYVKNERGVRLHGDSKVLILCNRHLLREQYFYDVALGCEEYRDIEETVDVITYQDLSFRIRGGKSIKNIFGEYCILCLDEVHYFFQDADFNGCGTYPLFLAIIQAGFRKQMIFMSATMYCISPFIKENIKIYYNYLRGKYWEEQGYIFGEAEKQLAEIVEPVHDLVTDYSFLNCICIPDQKTLCYKLAESTGKSVVFIDDKAIAAELARDLEETGLVRRNEICILNSDNMDSDENRKIVKTLAMANRVVCKILITTSVLDNGVSIKDKGVKNIVIFTESEVSFMQMLGRVRCECVEGKLNFYFMPRPAEYFERREMQYRKIMDVYEEIKRRTLGNCILDILNSLLNTDDERGNIFKKILTVFPGYLDINTSLEMRGLSCQMGDLCFAVNPFAIKKIGNAYLMESKFHKLARMDELKVIVEQLSWIGLSEKDLQMEDSTYLEEKKRKFKEKILTMDEFTNDEYSHFKEEINEEFGNDFFRDIVPKKGSFSKEKFEAILQRFGCKLKESTAGDGKKRYTVSLKSDEEE